MPITQPLPLLESVLPPHQAQIRIQQQLIEKMAWTPPIPMHPISSGTSKPHHQRLEAISHLSTLGHVMTLVRETSLYDLSLEDRVHWAQGAGHRQPGPITPVCSHHPQTHEEGLAGSRSQMSMGDQVTPWESKVPSSSAGTATLRYVSKWRVAIFNHKVWAGLFAAVGN